MSWEGNCKLYGYKFVVLGGNFIDILFEGRVLLYGIY